jgi:hypothetical protein
MAIKKEDLAKFGYKPDMTYEFFLINLLLYLFIAYYKLIKPIKRNLGFLTSSFSKKNLFWRLKPSD